MHPPPRRAVALGTAALVLAAAALSAGADPTPRSTRPSAAPHPPASVPPRSPRTDKTCTSGRASAFPARPTASPFGINVNALDDLDGTGPYAPATYEAIAQRLRQANVGWVRMEFNWGAIIGHDPESRHTDSLQWAQTGCSVDRIVSRGMHVLGVLEYTPAWAVRRPSLAGVPEPLRLRYTPDDVGDWQRFVQAAVATFPDVHYWSIWNEPNSTGAFYGDAPGDSAAPGDRRRIAAYNRLVAAAAPIIHASGGRVVGLELAVGNNNPGLHQRQWLQGVLGPGGQGQNIDVVAVHHYAGRAGDTRGVMDSLVPGSGVRNWRWPVWLTEVGLIQCTDGRGRRVAGAEKYCGGPGGVHLDEDSLAAHVAGVMSAPQHDPAAPYWVKTFYWHAYAELSRASQDWGILRGAAANALAPRPAYWAYARVAGGARAAAGP